MTVDQRNEDRDRTFERLADQYRGKPVVIPTRPLPGTRTMAAAWAWLLTSMENAR